MPLTTAGTLLRYVAARCGGGTRSKRERPVMGECGSTGKTASIMRAARHTLALYALVVLIVEAGLLTATKLTEGTSQTVLIIGMVIVLVLVVAVAGWRYTKPQDDVPSEVAALWTGEDIPLPSPFAQSWIGTWNCRWSFRTPDGKLRPYVHDRISIESADHKTGKVTGRGLSAYASGETYLVHGRLSKRRLAHFFYSSPAPRFGLSGMVILRMAPVGGVGGWWLGVGRDGGDVGGEVTWTRAEHDPDKEFQPQVYAVRGER